MIMASLQVLFLVGLAGAVIWLAYLAWVNDRHA
jgi:hypothetical protein